MKATSFLFLIWFTYVLKRNTFNLALVCNKMFIVDCVWTMYGFSLFPVSFFSLMRHWSLSLTHWSVRPLSQTSSLSSFVEPASLRTIPWAAPQWVAAW